MTEDEGEYNPALHEHIYDVVENQIKQNEAKETLERQMRFGYSRHDVVHKIGAVVVEETYSVLKEKKVFDECGFVEKPGRLK